MAKWDGKRKLKRNKLLLEYYVAHPELSLREIGEIFEVSAQRVWQLVRGEEKKLNHRIKRRGK